MSNNLYTSEEQILECKQLLNRTDERFESNGLNTESIINMTSDNPKVNKWKAEYRAIHASIKGISSGLAGERDALDSLKFHKDDMVLLNNIQTPGDKDGPFGQENDILAICPWAIYTCEIKSMIASSLYIAPTGYAFKNGDLIHPVKNIARQVNFHVDSIEKLLRGTKFENVPVVPVVAFTNPSCVVTNDYIDEDGNKIFIDTYVNNLGFIFKKKQASILSMEDMQELKQLILNTSAKYQPRKYPLVVDEDEYLDLVNKVVKICA